MGTNYYRIPKEDEVIKRKEELLKTIIKMDLSLAAINIGFSVENPDGWDRVSPWDVFMDGMHVHLGKASGSWKFCWNFHDNLYYSNKEELLNYIRSGRVIDEYGEEEDVEEFIKFALNWCPEGKIVDEKYRMEQKNKGVGDFFLDARHDDKIIDGLRVSSSTEFS